MTSFDTDVIVIGAGLVGSAAAWMLARGGAEVQLVEARSVGHHEGSSHGSSRIFRRGYPQAEYVALTGRAQELWSEMATECGTDLLRRTGGIDHGPARELTAIRGAFDQLDVPYQVLHPAAASARWPGMVFDGEVLFQPEAGVIDADRTVQALIAAAARHGAELIQESPVDCIEPADDEVVVHIGERRIRARRAVVAAGAWVRDLLPECIAERFPEYTVTQQQVFHFPLRSPDVAWPVLIHRAGVQPDDEIYALPSGSDGGRAPAFKIAEHERGIPTTAQSRSFRVDPESRRRMIEYARHWLPGVVPEVAAETTCLYTTTADRDFVLDRVGAVVIASACSGHGAKFTPATGELIARLATSDTEGSARFALPPRRQA